jgi:hypothetical protein
VKNHPAAFGDLLEACEIMVNSRKACLASESFLDLDMTIPTEPIGSIPRPQKLITAFAQYERGSLSPEEFESICSEAVRETIEKFEGLGAKNWGASQAGLSGERGQNEVYPVREGRGK